MQPPDDLDSTVTLDPNEDIVERTAPGEEPLWLWTQTCPVQDCPCRTVLVVAAASREQLESQVDIVSNAWDEAEDAESFQATVPSDVIAFELEIDSGGVSMPLADDAVLSPAVARIAMRIDGNLLDRLASQWNLGKEMPDTSTVPVSPACIRGFAPGQLLAWDEVYSGARMDIYASGGIAVEAIDTYCVRPKCECNEVRIQFYQLPEIEGEGEDELDTEDEEDLDDVDDDAHEDDAHDENVDATDEAHDVDASDDDVDASDDARGSNRAQAHGTDMGEHVFVGTVNIKLEDPVQVSFRPSADQAASLEDLFGQYQRRYPNWVERLSDRADKMAAFGEKLHAHLEEKAKLARSGGAAGGRKGKGKRH
jgi:hypothetical protein